MRIVDRLLLRELFGPVLNSVLMFLMLLFTSAYLFKLTDLLVQGASFGLVVRAALYSLPMLVTQTLPMGLLLGTLLAYGRLSGDSENIALYASGISFYRMVRPLIWVGLFLGLFAIAWNETVVPPATREYYRIAQDALENLKATDTPLSYVSKDKDGHVKEFVSIAGGFDAKSRLLRKVTIIKMSSDPKRIGQADLIVYADRAVLRNPEGTDADFYDGRTIILRYIYSGPKEWYEEWGDSSLTIWESITRTPQVAKWYAKEFKQLSTLPEGVTLGRDFKGIMQSEVTDNRRMTFQELRDKINSERAQGNPNTLGDEFDLWSKISLPLATLIFGLVAAPLGLRPHRGSRAMGFGLAVGIIFLYWVVHNWMFQVGKNGTLPPMLAAFTADMLGLLAAAFLIARTRQ